MLRSMTGYGEKIVDSDFGGVRIELKSVNHRYFDLRIYSPRVLSFMEPEFREELRKKVKRGMVFLNVSWDKSDSELGELRLNQALVDSLKKNLRKIKGQVKGPVQVPLELIANFPGVLYFTPSSSRQKKIRLIIRRVFKEALDNLVKSRIEEGHRIEKDMKSRAGLIKKELSKIEHFLPGYKEKLKKSLKEKLKQIQVKDKIPRERLNKEIAFNLIRFDFTEEMVRIKSHLKSLGKIISKETSGKNIEFLLQEIGREVNTLSDKANEVNISGHAIKIKVELEKLREQALNLE